MPDVTAYEVSTANASNTVTVTAEVPVTITLNGMEIKNGDSISWENAQNVLEITVGGGVYSVTVTKS